MGKAAMCIQLLEILSTGRVYKISDLANLLETNPRNIVEYKKELEECGYYILSISGRYGGYQLEKSAVIPALKLLTEEKTTLLESFNYVMSKKDFPKKETLVKAMGKVSASIELEEKENDLLVVDHYQLTMSEKDIQDRYHFIEEAIEKKRIIEIEYESIKSGLKIHKLHPYKLFIYNNSWFFLALNPEVGEIWYFKLNRIRHFHMLDGKFTVWKNFKAEDYFDGNGFKNNGDFIHVVFLVKGVHKYLVQERVYGKNQKVTPINDDVFKVELDMQNEDQVAALFLGWGLDVQVVEPLSLVTKIKKLATEVSNLYEE